jgi:hypothetical protein
MKDEAESTRGAYIQTLQRDITEGNTKGMELLYITE